MEKIKIGLEHKEVVLSIPPQKSNVGIIFVPGISGEAIGARYDLLAETFQQAGYYFLRYAAWKNQEELGTKNISSIHQEFDDLIIFLRSKGCTQIGFIGKSFGGGLSLTYRHPTVKGIVVWAPAFGTAEKDNIEEWKHQNFNQIHSTTDIKLSKQFLRDLTIPVRIIQGTADAQIPLSNSEKLLPLLPRGELIRLAGVDHSYGNPEQMRLVIERTVEFFEKVIPLHSK